MPCWAVGLFLATGLAATEEPVTPGAISGETLLRHVTTLASDEFAGRLPGTPGETLTLQYLVAEFKRLGVAPAGPGQSYLQSVPLAAIRSSPAFSFTVDGRELDLQQGRDCIARSFRLQAHVTLPDSEVVFAGYGIVAPEFGWDDYKTADVRGKTVIVLEGEPPGAEPGQHLFRGSAQSVFATPAYKYELAGRQGAAAVLLIRRAKGPLTASLQASYAQEAWDLDASESTRHPAAVEGRLGSDAFALLGTASGHPVAALTAAAERRDFQPVPLKVRAHFEIKNEVRKFTSANVVAQVPGGDPARAGEAVVYTAHWDHLGRDPTLAGDQVYNGAIDNAAGVAQLLEIAGALARASRRPARTVLFIATTAEEKGYLGARHYVTHPLFPLERTLAAINLDSSNVWGRTSDVLNLGLGLTSLDETLASTARRQDRTLTKQQYDDGSYFFASDQVEFAKAGIPAVFPSAGSLYRGQPPEYGDRKWGEYGEKRYHQVTDEVEADWDLTGTVEDAEWLWWIGWDIAQAETYPVWKSGSGFFRHSQP
jgi:Zn-dependent M28 family amino/carboxypeptidase